MTENGLNIKWDSKFEIGISYIDKQHKILLDLCATLYQEIMNSQKTNNTNWQNSLATSLKQCVDYVKYHFSSEEKLMTNAKYEFLNKHKLEHITFSKKVLEIANKYQTWRVKDAIDFVKFLYDWILTHIAIEDKKLKVPILNYLNSLKQNNQ